MNRINKISLFLMAFFPIIDSYRVFDLGFLEIRLNDFLCILLLIIFILQKRIFINLSFLKIHVYLLIVNLVVFLFSRTNSTSFALSMRVQITWIIYALFVSSTWGNNQDFSIFYRSAIIIGYIVAIYSIIQLLTYKFYNVQLSGKLLPFLPLSKNNSFASIIDLNTGAIRVNSFFEEPSYLGIYQLPILYNFLVKRKLRSAAFIFLSCILSGSLVATLGSIVCLVIFILMNKNVPIVSRIVILVIGLISIASLYIFVEDLQYMLISAIRRISNFRFELSRENSSFNMRLFGDSIHFKSLPVFNKLFGTGVNQYPLFLHLEKHYSNDIVIFLLNYGIIGILVYFMFWKDMIMFRSNDIAFILIAIMISLIDHIWFNWFFFYLLTWGFEKNNRRVLW